MANKLPFILLFFLAFIGYSQDFGDEQKSIGDAINSKEDESVPVVSPDGNTLYFTRAHHPGNVGGKSDKGDIWMSKKGSNGQWELPKM
ncbi:PD40 domain-containing protein [Mangrovivirga cuniculi]|uniref:Uncharacterized protein n=1 Tax=Mangrovivirga cuniculi TaxID=2715131 RepID=A0A4D7K3U2_9BACT|nr:PD40 domain-containing protein [Mangrovivirga cuniculi]QCK15494.1 hypothetical protein DCC35_12445 [Mangrovivirga cuniculi]